MEATIFWKSTDPIRTAWLIVSILVLAGCGKSSKNSVIGPLESVVRTAKDVSPCDRLIPGEWVYTWPIPAEPRDSGRFEILFYPIEMRRGGKYLFHAPRARAVVDPGKTAVVDCRLTERSVRASTARRWPDLVTRMSVAEFERLEHELYRRTEEVGRLYGLGRPLTTDEAQAARAYRVLFESLAEPDLLRDYEAENRSFWAWLRQAT
jgi:hypothetical protein